MSDQMQSDANASLKRHCQIIKHNPFSLPLTLLYVKCQSID